MSHVMQKIDRQLLPLAKAVAPWLGRVSLFVVFFWFGILKVVGTSPANEIVAALQYKMLPFMPSAEFIVVLGVLEMAIGALFLIPRCGRVAIALLLLHMVTTFLPILFLPGWVWADAFTPTLEGQYILKNLVIVALAIGIASRFRPLRSDERDS